MNFNFKFGNKKPSKKDIIIVSIVISSIIAGLSQCTGVPESNIWDLYDEIQRRFFPQTILNELIIKDDEKLKRRIKRDVDNAISDYEEWERKSYKPNMTNKNILNEIESDKYTEIQRLIVKDAIYYECPSDGSKAQSLLGGAMGIRGVWTMGESECENK